MGKPLQVNPIFSDHMVLQRDEQNRVWGTCARDAQVQIEIENYDVAVIVEGTSWSALLPPMKTTKGTKMIISSDTEKIEIQNIAIGDVWVAGEQSNIEFYMRHDADFKEEVLQCKNSDIRFFDVPEVCYQGQEEDFDYSRMAYWRTCDKENLEYFSAVGYYFAKNIHADLDVPINGHIGANIFITTVIMLELPRYIKTFLIW